MKKDPKMTYGSISGVADEESPILGSDERKREKKPWRENAKTAYIVASAIFFLVYGFKSLLQVGGGLEGAQAGLVQIDSSFTNGVLVAREDDSEDQPLVPAPPPTFKPRPAPSEVQPLVPEPEPPTFKPRPAPSEVQPLVPEKPPTFEPRSDDSEVQPLVPEKEPPTFKPRPAPSEVQPLVPEKPPTLKPRKKKKRKRRV